MRSIGLAALICLAATQGAIACNVVLKRAVPACPAVTTRPSDCEGMGTFGHAGETVSPGVLHVMASGYAYFCPAHASCVEEKDLTFTGCRFTKVPGGESSNYLESFDVR